METLYEKYDSGVWVPDLGALVIFKFGGLKSVLLLKGEKGKDG